MEKEVIKQGGLFAMKKLLFIGILVASLFVVGFAHLQEEDKDCEAPPPPPPIEERLKQPIWNVVNQVRRCSETGVVTVRVSCSENGNRICPLSTI